MILLQMMQGTVPGSKQIIKLKDIFDKKETTTETRGNNMKDYYPNSTMKEVNAALKECIRQNLTDSDYARMLRKSFLAKIQKEGK